MLEPTYARVDAAGAALMDYAEAFSCPRILLDGCERGGSKSRMHDLEIPGAVASGRPCEGEVGTLPIPIPVGSDRMSRGKFRSLEDARPSGTFKRFCAEHPLEADRRPTHRN